MLSKKELEAIKKENDENPTIQKLVDELSSMKNNLIRMQFFIDEGLDIMQKAEKQIIILREAIENHKNNTERDGCSDEHNEDLWDFLDLELDD
jgi:hypothetical protein